MQAKLVETSAERFIDAVGAEPQDYAELTYSGRGESGHAMAITRGLFVSMRVEFRLGSDAVTLATNFGDLRKAVAETRGADCCAGPRNGLWDRAQGRGGLPAKGD